MSRPVIVCGGRDYRDAAKVDEVLSALNPSSVAQGGASGADALAREWARARGIVVVTYHADWRAYGPAAGPRRNREMLERVTGALVVAFPGGKGTADMVRQARAKGVEVHEA